MIVGASTLSRGKTVGSAIFGDGCAAALLSGEAGAAGPLIVASQVHQIPSTAGAVSLIGRDITHADREALRAVRRDLQIVFQDPLASLDPRMTIGDSIAEPLRAFRAAMTRRQREDAVRAMMPKQWLRSKNHG